MVEKDVHRPLISLGRAKEKGKWMKDLFPGFLFFFILYLGSGRRGEGERDAPSTPSTSVFGMGDSHLTSTHDLQCGAGSEGVEVVSIVLRYC